MHHSKLDCLTDERVIADLLKLAEFGAKECQVASREEWELATVEHVAARLADTLTQFVVNAHKTKV